MGRVWVVGSLNQDLQLSVERHPRTGETVMAGDLERRFGGKGANQAIAAVRAGADTSMVGAVGDDDPGAAYLARLGEFGVDVTGVRRVAEAPTGTAVICVDADHDNLIMVSPGANHHLTTEHLTSGLSLLAAGDVVLVQLEIPLEVVVAAVGVAADRGARVIANLAPYADLPVEVLERCDPVVVNESEFAELTRSGRAGPDVLVTLGTAGSRWGDLTVPAVLVEPVDTTGAGDCYCGTLAARLALGDAPEAAMIAASRAAAACVAHEGAQPPVG